MIIDRDQSPYFVSPAFIEGIVAILQKGEGSFSNRCSEAAKTLCLGEVSYTGIEHVPINGQIVVAQNHPFHYDFVLLHPLFALRPDLHIIIKSQTQNLGLPRENFIGMPASPQLRMAVLRQLLSSIDGGMSLYTMPFGYFDHLTTQTPEQAFHNLTNLTHRVHSCVVPVSIEPVWQQGTLRTLPISSASVRIGEPILADDIDKLREFITTMYTTYIASRPTRL